MITLVTGGARSGKSRFAESLGAAYTKKVYVATGIAYDKEMEDRIKKHQLQRGQSWETIEGYNDLDKRLQPMLGAEFILIDCITIMVTNIMLSNRDIDWDNISMEEVNEIENSVLEEINKLIEFGEEFSGKMVIVTNELGMGLVPEYPLGRYFRDIAGRVNQKLAQKSSEVYFLVSGIEIKIKG